VKKSNVLVLIASCVALSSMPALAESVATPGTMLVSTDGSRLGAVYRVVADSSAQLIFNGKLVTVPASTLSRVDGRLTTSLKKSEVASL
jgi:hypothetical protein